MEKPNEWMDLALTKGTELLVAYGPKLLLAILTLLIGLRLIRWSKKLIGRSLDKAGADPNVKPFLTSLITALLKVILIIAIASMVGIATTSFIAVLGAAGLAIGLALQGSLANFAGGVLIMIFKPYKVGDLIETEGHLGVVQKIHIFTTTMTSPENKTIIVPNGAISNGSIVNYTELGLIRVDMLIGIHYDADISKAKEVLTKVLKDHEFVLEDPAPFVGVKELADSAIVLAVRPYCDPAHYWDVYFDVLEQGKHALTNANVAIPYPQMDVHMIQ